MFKSQLRHLTLRWCGQYSGQYKGYRGEFEVICRLTTLLLVDEAIRQRAEELGHNGLKAVDALHVACAERLRSDYFITCDRRLIDRCAGLTLKVVNPVDFVLEVNGDDQKTSCGILGGLLL